MKEAKTYVSFLLVSGVLVGILAFLYSPNNPKTNTISVMENLESRTLDDEESQPENTQEQTESQEVDDGQGTTQDVAPAPVLTEEEKEEIQRKRIHLTTILLRKQKQLEDLQDKKNRTTGSTEAIESEILEVEAFIESLTKQIQELSS